MVNIEVGGLKQRFTKNRFRNLVAAVWNKDTRVKMMYGLGSMLRTQFLPLFRGGGQLEKFFKTNVEFLTLEQK
jgi:hypothetical protein